MAEALLTVAQAKRIAFPIIYGLCDLDGTIFYVGKTASAFSRFGCHSAARTKNHDLKARLSKGDWRVLVLCESPADINAAERQMIAAHSPGLLNVILADDGRWDGWAKNSRPWSVGNKFKSPSAYAMPIISKRARDLVRTRMAKMTDAERCLYEFGLYEGWPALRGQFAAWFSLAHPRMSESVEAEYGPA